MSKKWYPMINYELCAECGICTDKCCCGVYDEEKAPRPVVVNPEGCIQGCKGCGSLCPNEAITYFGDNGSTGSGCCDGDCDCGCDGSC